MESGESAEYLPFLVGIEHCLDLSEYIPDDPISHDHSEDTVEDPSKGKQSSSS